MLLLDEPTNHLDAESVDWLEQFLQRYPGNGGRHYPRSLLLGQRSRVILELDRGNGMPYKGNYSDWLQQKQERLVMEQKGEESRAKALKKELEWSRQNSQSTPSQEQGSFGPF